MKHLLCMMLLAVASTVPVPAPAADRVLPSLALSDDAGRPANLAALSGAQAWTLVVVNPARPQTQAALARLLPQAGAGGEHLIVVGVGPEAPFNELVRKHGQRPGLRFYRDAEGTVVKTLRLPGLPAVLGIDSGNRIAWQRIGVPPEPARARSLVESWAAGATQPGAAR